MFASFKPAVLALLAVGACIHLPAADCDSGLTPQAKAAKFKELDSKAEAAMRQHRPAEAAVAYKEAACLFPDSARAYYGLGVAQADAGDLRAARDSLRTSDNLQPKTAAPLAMQIRVNYSLRDLDALKSNLRELARRFPNDSVTHAALARFLAQHELFVLALAEALRSNGNDADWNSKIQLAVLENTVGAYTDAIKHALTIDQNTSAPESLRAAAAGVAGLSYESLGQGDESAKYLTEAIQLDPTQENSYLALSDLLDQEQKYAEAVRVLQQGRAHLPDSAPVLLALGTEMVRAEHPAEGVQILRQVLQSTPDVPDAYISIAEAARNTGNASEEVGALRQLERLHADYPMIHLLLARAMLNQQPPEYSAILDELVLAAKSAPDDPDVCFLQGKTYVAMGRYEQAQPFLERSIALRPIEPSTYYQLARVYQKLGKRDLAQQQFERVKYLEQNAAK